MKVFMPSVGTRGDVQPILALALEFESLRHRARLCAAPNFADWIEACGIEFRPIGPDIEKEMAPPPGASREQILQLLVQEVRSQFPVLVEAARGCDLVVAGGVNQFAARSVADVLEVPYVYVAYCPAALPSLDHPPPTFETPHPQSLPGNQNAALWQEETRKTNELFRDAVNGERAKLGLDPIGDVHKHILTGRPWLAADPTLGPAAATRDMRIFQTGAWLLEDQRPLPAHVEAFLDSGPSPVYFGFGSMAAVEQTSRVLIGSARALGLRSIISQGWGNLHPIDAGSDCLLVEDVAHGKLFSRVTAVVHHGGAGTTTVAAGAGVPQVIVPHTYDQHYWAHRVRQLGLGATAPARAALNVEGICSALRNCANLETHARARSFARRIDKRGARAAAERLIRDFG